MRIFYRTEKTIKTLLLVILCCAISTIIVGQHIEICKEYYTDADQWSSNNAKECAEITPTPEEIIVLPTAYLGESYGIQFTTNVPIVRFVKTDAQGNYNPNDADEDFYIDDSGLRVSQLGTTEIYLRVLGYPSKKGTYIFQFKVSKANINNNDWQRYQITVIDKLNLQNLIEKYWPWLLVLAALLALLPFVKKLRNA